MDESSTSRPGHRVLRRGRVSLAGQVYLVTFTTVGRQPLFLNPEAARIASSVLAGARVFGRSRLLAWVLMPDHWHGLIELGDGEDLAALVGRIKTNSSRCVRKETTAPGRVWARAFHDHALRMDECILAAARYIVLNPVRAGLVASLRNYPYWNAIWL